MKTIGLIGGMSWESTSVYYRLLNEAVRNRLGGLHSAKVIVASLDFAEVAKLQQQQAWKELEVLITDVAIKLQHAGVDMVGIATNTMHILAEKVQNKINIPLIHIADAIAIGIGQANLGHLGLLGTKFTMEGSFYKNHLETKYGLSISIPESSDREEVNRIIFEELCRGKILESSRLRLFQIIDHLLEKGIQGIILGCTELPLILNQHDMPDVKFFDTLWWHANLLIEKSLE